MNKRRIYLPLVLISCLTILTYGCNQQQKDANKQPENTCAIHGSVHELVIHPETIDFPEHEGKALFMSYCSVCHSLKYISMQPDFPRKTWEAEVTKMVAKYKAPIDSVTCLKIVDYLAAVKSKA